MINKAILVGNLGRDPEVRQMQNGDSVCNLSIATSERWKDKNSGESRDKTEWHRVTIFGKVADIIGQYAKKGSTIYIEGKIQTRKWQDQDGNDRYTTEIVVSGFGGKVQLLNTRQNGSNGNESHQPEQEESQTRASSTLDDEIPF